MRQFGTRAANVARSTTRPQAALDRRQLQTAEQIVAVLGTMKGAAMKLGQVMSFLDVGLVPEEFREEFQAKLAALRDAAPKVSFQDMKKVIEGEYDEPLDEVFETFDPVPIAAASIGQVYKARAARRARRRGQGPVPRRRRRGARRHAEPRDDPAADEARSRPGSTRKALGDEIRARIDEELDYELEAANQRTLARIFRGHPFIVVPDVVTRASREKRGRQRVRQRPRLRGDQAAARRPSATASARSSSASTSAACTATTSSAATRIRATRCCSTTGAWRSWTSGCSSGSRREVAEFELQTPAPRHEGRGEELIELLHDGGFIGDPSFYTAEKIMAQFHDLTWWYTTDEEVLLTPEIATEVMIQMSDPRSRALGPDAPRDAAARPPLRPPLETLTLAVLGQLRAKANWHRITREWVYGDEPVTELGRQEAEFYAARERGDGCGWLALAAPCWRRRSVRRLSR